MIDLHHITAARARLAGIAYHTPLEYAPVLSERTGRNVYLKLENVQRTGAFKIRGAYNRVACLTDDERRRGIATASTGNHALGVALAAMRLGLSCQLFVPETISQSKLTALRRYPVDLIVAGHGYEEAEEIAVTACQHSGRTFISPVDDIHVAAGHGTIVLEMLDDEPALDGIVVPVGGGGLVCGVGSAVRQRKPNAAVIGCQSIASCAMYRSLREERVYDTFPSAPTIADGLEGGISETTYRIGREVIDEMLVVTEEEIRQAIAFLLREHCYAVEGSAAVGVAALLFGRVTLPCRHVGVILTGSHLDWSLLREIVREYGESLNFP